MRNTDRFVATLAMSTVFTIVLTFGLCVALTLFWVFDGTLTDLLCVAALLAVLVGYVFIQCWNDSSVRLRTLGILYAGHYVLAWITALVYWILIRRV